MTDTSSTAHAHSTANPFPFPATTSPLPSPVANGTGSTHEAEEDEPYTIKCICSFEDDDGSTVLCERCDTWQHIACYYIDKKNVPEIHNCVDCEPRHLDGKRATERQRKLREQNDSNSNAADERRGSRRSGSKSQRKKPKDLGSPSGTGEQRNGWSSHERSASAASRENGNHQQQPVKKQRTAHRASNSISSVGGDSRKRGNNANKSPASSFPQIPLYSQEFLHLYDNDNASLDMQGNLFRTIGLTNDLASWVKDPVALAQVANGRTAKEVFNHTDQPLDPSTWPPLTKQTIVDNNVEIDGRHPTWQCLKVQSNVRKDEIVGEVRGKVGHFRDYCHDPDSRWQELRHPEPFVFFHPQLPIYIDSREEGTVLRYIRRSCRPNVTMRTYITNQVEYHFCFVANQDIPMDTEISTTWYLDPKMFPSNGLVKEEGLPDGSLDPAAISISNVLAHFGGCACDDSVRPCLLANIDCRIKPKSLESNTKQTNGRRKKAKAKGSAVSPDSSGGVPAHSRSGSEVVRNQDEDDHADTRSTSGSLKDQPANRDLTPGALGRDVGELSAREKRKIAAAEKKFEQLEHDQHHPKKKKRVHPPRGQSPNLSKAAKPPHLDIPQSRRSSHSPAKMSPESASHRRDGHFTPPKTSAASTPRVVSPLSRPVYVDCSVQTDPDENDPQYVPLKTFNAPRFMTLTQRLLRRCHEDRIKMEDRRLDSVSALTSPDSGAGAMLPPSTPVNSRLAPPPKQAPDVEMKDADSSMTPPNAAASSASPTTASPVSLSSPPSCPLFHLPSTVAHNLPTPRKISDKVNMRIPLPPPQFPPATSSISSPDSASKPVPPISITKPLPPSKLQTGPAQTPPSTSTSTTASSLTAPSPVKKKLSLNDYMSRRGTLTTPTTEKPPNPFLPSITSPAPSPGSADPSPTTQFPFTRFAESQSQIHGHGQSASPDILMKDAPHSPSTIFPPPHADPTTNGSTSNGNKPNAVHSLNSRDPRLLDRG
ncbi:SET domain-containing protein 3 [Microsporum audouinii]